MTSRLEIVGGGSASITPDPTAMDALAEGWLEPVLINGRRLTISEEGADALIANLDSPEFVLVFRGVGDGSLSSLSGGCRLTAVRSWEENSEWDFWALSTDETACASLHGRA